MIDYNVEMMIFIVELFLSIDFEMTFTIQQCTCYALMEERKNREPNVFSSTDSSSCADKHIHLDRLFL